MVGGYVFVVVPAVLATPGFESGTAIPGIYETLRVAFSTGKIPVFQFDGPVIGGALSTPYTSNFVKAPDGSFRFSAINKNYVVNSDDTVVIN